ncbi:glycosyltransferase family A protein [Conexibacter sp. CPCC 206217]|uniref:glycosyltransferase family A protein n=1 Tax=Conexibacter sp. CPCC 206217 TaxID=3064574 RepID=UPI002725EA06|nr:glycosyltransferase family A protein [Conexibacter sp. CPCC 206217]MDO8209847.1 glycosyltransferase family A protein [Conexibacter sp. CPCC 206217]
MARPLLAPAPSSPPAPAAAPSFSIVITAYEVAPYLGEAVRSALEQTLPAADVVVVDDGSSDDVDGALAPYRDRITLVRQVNQGPGAAKLAGARAASGEFVSFLDGDDVYLPQRLEALAEAAAARPDLDVLQTDAWVESGGERLRRVYDETWEFEVDDQRRGILTRCFVLGHAAARRALLVALDGSDRTTLDDWECWIRLILDGARAGCVQEPLSVYRVRPGSLSTGRTSLYRRGTATLRKFEAEPGLSEAERTALVQTRSEWSRLLTLELARDALHAGDRRAARPLLKRIVRSRGYDPRARLKALISLLAPGVARRLLAERAAKEWVGAGGMRVSR